MDPKWNRHGASGPVPIKSSAPSTLTVREMAPLPVSYLTDNAKAAWNRWKSREPVFQQMVALRTYTLGQMMSWRVPVGMQWFSDPLEPDFPYAEQFWSMASMTEGPGSNEALSAAIYFSQSKALELADLPSWYHPSEGLTYALLGTHLKGVRPDDVRLPFPGFFIELPAGIMMLLNNLTGYHEVRALCVCEGGPERPPTEELPATPLGDGDKSLDPGYGRRLLIVVYCEPNENSTDPSDDNVLYFSLPLFDSTKTLDELLVFDKAVSGEDPRDALVGGTIVGVPRTNLELRTVLRTFVVNFLLYLNSPEADVRHANEGRARSLRQRKRGAQKHREKIDQLLAEPSWLVGTTIKLTPEFKEAVQDSGRKTGKELRFKSLVRGFWRMQWYGKKTPEHPKGTEQRPKWIEPFVRGGDLPGRILGHTYEVKGTK